MGMREKPWNMVVEPEDKILLSLDVNTVARFSVWGEVLNVSDDSFSISVDIDLPSYYDAKFFLIPSPGVLFFGYAGVYISPSGTATVYPEGKLVYAEDAFDGDVVMKPFAIPVQCDGIKMSMLYLDPKDVSTGIIRALIPKPTFIKQTFCDVVVYIPQEYAIKEASARLDVVFATEVVFGRNEGVGVYGSLHMDPYDLSLISSAYVPFAGE